jgi:hypothetical protein
MLRGPSHRQAPDFKEKWPEDASDTRRCSAGHSPAAGGSTQLKGIWGVSVREQRKPMDLCAAI